MSIRTERTTSGALRDDNPPTGLNASDAFRERSVASDGWILRIVVNDGGSQLLDVDEIDEILIHFRHTFFTRQERQ